MLQSDLLAQLLIAFGFLFIIAEVFVPALGILALIGIITFVWGGVIVQTTPEIQQGFLIPEIVWGMGVLAIIILAIGSFLTLRAMRSPNTTGQESLIGKKAHVMEWDNAEKKGLVRVNGEIWKATTLSKKTIAINSDVEITAASDTALTVVPD